MYRQKPGSDGTPFLIHRRCRTDPQGPIGAAMFGWLPVTLWILIGGIFFGGVHDFGALFASVRSKGQSIGEIISANMSKRAKQLFIIFSYLTPDLSRSSLRFDRCFHLRRSLR